MEDFDPWIPMAQIGQIDSILSNLGLTEYKENYSFLQTISCIQTQTALDAKMRINGNINQ